MGVGPKTTERGSISELNCLGYEQSSTLKQPILVSTTDVLVKLSPPAVANPEQIKTRGLLAHFFSVLSNCSWTASSESIFSCEASANSEECFFPTCCDHSLYWWWSTAKCLLPKRCQLSWCACCQAAWMTESSRKCSKDEESTPLLFFLLQLYKL